MPVGIKEQAANTSYHLFPRLLYPHFPPIRHLEGYRHVSFAVDVRRDAEERTWPRRDGVAGMLCFDLPNVTYVLADSAWAKAECLARRIYELATVPMRSENHPTWDPTWRAAIERGLRAIGSGDELEMEHALMAIEELATTL